MHITSPTRLSPAHLLLAIIVVAIWGSNFVVIRIGLNQFPPFTFATLRFLLASLPLLPFFRWPETDWKNVVVYGLLIGAGQFGLMLYAMSGDISPGLASVLIQTQAFFTVALAVYFAGERIGARNIFGLLLCAAGVTIVIFMGGGEASPIGVALVLGGAFCWAMGNIVARRAGPINALSLVAWSNIFAILPLAAMALLFEGPSAIGHSLTHADMNGWLSIFWQAFGNAIFGYAVWNWLLGCYPASQVAPLGLLVPIFGLSSAAIFLGEPMPLWKLVAAAAIISGLAVNAIRPRARG